MEHFRKYEKGEENLPLMAVVDLKNGREAISELCGKPCFLKLPFVVFSTTGTDFEKQRCLDLGFTAYFVKRADYSLLLDVARQFRDVAAG